jgi:hypothetical protein
MANTDKIHKDKLKFLERRENTLKKNVSGAQRKLLTVLVNKFMDQLQIENGKIVQNAKNIRLTLALDTIFNSFDKNINSKLIKSYADDMKGSTARNAEYFKSFEPNNKKFKKIKTGVDDLINARLGIKDNKPVKGGFLDNFNKDSRMRNGFKELVTKGITGGVSRSDMNKQVRSFIVGTDGVGGALQKEYANFIYDTYQQVDNLAANNYAVSLNMQSFIYSGGKIKTTREFCCQRNGLIFTVKEAQKWQTLTFTGKSNPYNPLINLGGYNCRHSTQYISNITAAKRRSDLKLDKKGNLIKDATGTKQRLNQCS